MRISDSSQVETIHYVHIRVHKHRTTLFYVVNRCLCNKTVERDEFLHGVSHICV